MSRSRTAILVGALVAVFAVPSEARAATVCASMGQPILHVARATSGASLLTPSPVEAGTAATYGFTDVQGPLFRASVTPRPGLFPVHRMFNPATRDFAWFLAGSAGQARARADGYVDQGANFYTAAAPIPGCTRRIGAFTRGGHHRYATTEQAPALQAAGWVRVGSVFDAPLMPPPASTDPDTRFSFAVMPDTQNEVGDADLRLPKRVSWLVQNKARLDLRWVLHSGDLQDWDTPDHRHFANMSRHLQALDRAALPFIAAPGNHDTAAVCQGGSACPGANTSVTVRDTATWNAYYPPSRFGFQGVYQAGKSDNGWRTFSAGGLNWLVLSLELWPRAAVVSWAKNVVATHPHHNVIVLTHSFLTARGGISASNGGYGATAPTALWAALDDFPNVVMTFSGHVGQVVNTSAAAADGHKVAMYLQAMHAASTNPVRIVVVDTRARAILTSVWSSFDRSLPVGKQDVTRVYPYNATVTGMRWVR